jgi:gliding motility-associated lipoprotein GldH
MKKYYQHILWCAFVFTCSACSQDEYLYFETKTLDNEVWEAQSPLVFRFSIEDTVKLYNIGLNVRYTQDYPAQNLYIFLHTTLPNGMIMCDTVLTDLFYLDGSPIGKQGARVIELEHTFSRMAFPLKGEYCMWIEQAVRLDTVNISNLKGIVSAGLYITNAHIKQDSNEKDANRKEK